MGTMVFRLPACVYTLHIREDLRDEGDQRCDGLSYFLDQSIAIDKSVPRRRRMKILLHELYHVWQHELGRVRGSESKAQNASAFTLWATSELNRQGGPAALMRLEPDGTLTATAEVPSGSGAECALCGTRFAAGRIINGPSHYDTMHARLVVRRSLYCEHCGQVQLWVEAATNGGLPTGEVLAGPDVRRGDDATEWLRVYGRQVGIVTTT